MCHASRAYHVQRQEADGAITVVTGKRKVANGVDEHGVARHALHEARAVLVREVRAGHGEVQGRRGVAHCRARVHGRGRARVDVAAPHAHGQALCVWRHAVIAEGHERVGVLLVAHVCPHALLL